MSVYGLYRDSLGSGNEDAAMEYAREFLDGIDTSCVNVNVAFLSDTLARYYADKYAYSKAIFYLERAEDIYEKAVAYHEIAESLNDIRMPIDKLEDSVDNKMWPLPKYRELLFIR